MKTWRLTPALFLALTLAACGPAVRSMTFLSPAPAPKPADHPIALFQELRPECPYEEIGTVSVRRPSRLVSMSRTTEGLRQRARQMGGDAIVGLGERIETRGGVISGGTIVANNDPVFSGTVVRFRDAGCARWSAREAPQ